MKVTSGDDSSGANASSLSEKAAVLPSRCQAGALGKGSSVEVDEHAKKPRKLVNISSNVERLQAAKEMAEQAIKARHIFTIAGPYPHVRESLRRRGWIEKFYRLEDAPKKSPRSKKKHVSDDDEDLDDDDDGDGDDDDLPAEEPAVKPWEEENGIYGIMSRMARNDSPTFIWCIRRDNVDFRFLKKHQMVNHYSRNGAFTTKVGLCMNVRNSRWFNDVDHNSFYPRCYRLSHEEEKSAFIDDYCLTACMGIVRWVVERYGGEGRSEAARSDDDEDDAQSATAGADEYAAHDVSPRRERRKKKKSVPRLPMSLLDTALQQCRHWMSFQDSDDLEDLNKGELLPLCWDVFLQQYYDLCHNGGVIPKAKARLHECDLIANRLRTYWPQFDMDGVRNVWIVKPGAKSRGRGITCYEKLGDMLKLVDSVVRKDSKYVVQKYIERPLLVHNTKFDIRQWFLVTDWNPLTIWWYKDCYLRFCKKQFSLSDFSEAIHLSNNSIQKHYDVDPGRSKDIPDDSMWSSDEFDAYLRSAGFSQGFSEKCLPAMKESVICSLQTTQDIIEYRKSSFELYGADFMLTDDLRPWLIEINSSPSMATTTRVTADLVPGVLEDTIKVLIDRKLDRTCDTGRFELIYKPTPVTVPQYLGITMAVEGIGLKCGNSGSAGIGSGQPAGGSTGSLQPPVAGMSIGPAGLAMRTFRKPTAMTSVGVAPFASTDDTGSKPDAAACDEKKVVLKLTDGKEAVAKLTQPRNEPLLVKRKKKWENPARVTDDVSPILHGSRVPGGSTPCFGKVDADGSLPVWCRADEDAWPGDLAESMNATVLGAEADSTDVPPLAGAALQQQYGDQKADRQTYGASRYGRETPVSVRFFGGARKDHTVQQVVVPLAPHKLLLSPPDFFSAPTARSCLPKHGMQRFRVDNRRQRELPKWHGHSFPEGQTMYFLATNLSQQHI